MKKVNIIACVDKNLGIGKKDMIPWNISIDTTYFNNITSMTRKGLPTNELKNAVIMGRKTWESIGNNLQDRLNVVISNSMINKDNIMVFKNYDDSYNYLNRQENIDRIFIIGGGELYNYILDKLNNIDNNLIDTIYLNKIDYDYDCDTFINKDKLEGLIENNKNIYDYNDNQKEVYKVYDKSINREVLLEFYKYSFYLEKRRNVIIKHPETQYIELLENLIKDGEYRETRNGSTWSLFSKSLYFNMKDGFPLLTSKKIDFKHVIGELLWFMRGDTDSKILEKDGIKIWVKNTTKQFIESNNLNLREGEIGPMYGFQLRHYGEEYVKSDSKYNGYDQIKYCLDLIKKEPTSRRIIMTTYNPSQAKKGVLYPCHGIVTQFYVRNNKLSLSTYQRSADVFLGLPWNIASYSLLLHIVCELINNDPEHTGYNLEPEGVTINLGDYHLYNEHYEKAVIQILRAKEKLYDFPELKIKNKFTKIEDIKIDDFEIINYKSYKGLIADMKA
jgi:dihydrofolate reductase/thymidylate synthase